MVTAVAGLGACAPSAGRIEQQHTAPENTCVASAWRHRARIAGISVRAQAFSLLQPFLGYLSL